MLFYMTYLLVYYYFARVNAPWNYLQEKESWGIYKQ